MSNGPGGRAGRLRPQDVRDATFTAAPRRRGGLDPEQVYTFLRHVADEMSRLHHELDAAMTDAVRVKNALHQWQVQHAATCAQPPAARPAQQQGGGGYGNGHQQQGW
ncbi:DivIVA domain-containing protein [Micromonospora sp. CPCC 206061]|uniref:DivIVA domain-containing protein n=1 Tax=Micromonospora sp. CPCC 206061 TaxID=3122410 RepID=UPI002FF09700